MANIATPKIFISYSWTTPEHQSWVIELAETLVQNGVDVVLDKWELHEGDDSHAFMERMVNDSSVTHIIMIIDEKYTARANDRSGGVGTESTILSNELYTKKGKNNIVAVLAEPNVNKPTFYASRIHIDLSNEEKYTEELEKLIRWAFGKFEYEKPVLGTPPSFIVAEDTGIVLNTNLEYKLAIDSLKKGKANVISSVKNYLEKLETEISKYKFDKNDTKQQFFAKLESFKAYVDEFKNITNEACLFRNSSIHRLYHKFFEELLTYQEVIPNGQSKLIAEIEFFRFITWILVLNYISILIKNESFDEVAEFLEEIYTLPEYFRNSENTKYRNFLVFKLYTDGFIDSLEEQKYYSIEGHLLKEFSNDQIVSFKELCETDLLIYLKSLVLALEEKEGGASIWWPNAGFYVLDRHNPLKIFAKSEKQSYFSEIKKILNIENLEFVQTVHALKDPHGWGNFYLPRWSGSFQSVNLITLTNYEKLKDK
ncbi:TIR domain-containing protein [Acinetobacter sp. YIM 103518]|uniref:TIR domain-containing protein n=1 Tax=Acinetobacter faecalis TaxID=2665161 RepID=A0A6L6GEF5_9GAMM|nr:toll/interleukin-1 receptor domain-containing protein [Acinetobacter faecalis]MTD10816.1 TIR domain-containing protein [Acinetobacter faecalis]